MALRGRPANMPGGVYAKIEKDVAPEALRNDLLAACDTAAPDEIDQRIRDFCDSNVLCGPLEVLDPDETLGHVKPESRTLNRLARVFDMSFDKIAAKFRYLAGEGSVMNQDQARHWFMGKVSSGGSTEKIANRPAWLFRAGVPGGDPFAGDRGCLPWRLALPHWADLPGRVKPRDPVACIGYRLPASAVVSPRKPTCMDAGTEGLSIYWAPGGKTAPHPHGPATCVGGLDEIVAEPPGLGDVVLPLVRFTSRTK